MSKTTRLLIFISIAGISLVMHFHDFSKDLMSLHVWRQTQTQSTIINFYEEDMNILDPRRNDRGNTDGIFRMEFPLMQWLVACTFKIFGNHLIISRIFMFITGLLSVLGIYKLLNALFRNPALSVIGAWAFSFSPSFYYYSVNPMPDNFALCCSIWGLALFFIWYNDKRIVTLALSCLLLSLGALCKLPFIVYFIVPFLYFALLIREQGLNGKTLLQAIPLLCSLLPPLAWYLSVIPQWHGNPVVRGMFVNEGSLLTTLDYYQHNLVSNLPELLLNYGSLLFFISGFYFLFKRRSYRDPKFPLILGSGIAVLIYYFYEADAIGKTHDYYLFPFYPFLFMLVAYGAFYLLRSKGVFFRYLAILLILLQPVTCYLRMQEELNPESPGFNKDLLIYRTELRNAVPEHALCIAGNDQSHFIWFYYINKKGWGFENDRLNATELARMISEGAKYIYTDSRAIDHDKRLIPFLDSLVLQKGSVMVYRLKNRS
ncbi:MAG: glycosyltransferase family 39 protein [Bacteroidetes bacterium]|nr:glycosyltransferase family 39 protein [Bacteroidota bacterium]